MCIRPDLFGVTSIVRAFGLKEPCYDRILDFFHSASLNIHRLSRSWITTVLHVFPGILKVNGRLLIVGDGIKVPKTGRKMPGVKLLHQESDSNTKPHYPARYSSLRVCYFPRPEKFLPRFSVRFTCYSYFHEILAR